jgi:sterol desaturase/sphingolipid hydroxylase (fatty acid hydroxylase superfamily)
MLAEATTWHKFADDFKQNFFEETFRYFLFAGITFLVFYVLGRKFFTRFKIQQKFPVSKHIWRELKYSLLSVVIFALNGVFVFTCYRLGGTKMYLDIHAHSWGYFVFSIFAFIVAHDFYFYWTHRFMHWKKIYPYVHKIHHLSHDPTPWAAYAFHPLEAVIQAAIFPIMAFIIPVHPLAVLIWGLYQATLNVMGHSGFELFHSGFTTGTITKWHNTSTHHNMHHKYANSNYGLYFNFWDRVMGTNHPKYTETFEGVKTQAKNFKAQVAGKKEAEPVYR